MLQRTRTSSSFVRAVLAMMAGMIRTVDTSQMSAFQVNHAYSNLSRSRSRGSPGKPQPAGSKLAKKAKKRTVGIRTMTYADKFKPQSLNLHSN